MSFPAMTMPAARSALYCDLVAKAAIDGISRSQGERGIDIGAAAEPVVEELPAKTDGLGFEPLSGPRGVADDLKKLPGVSPAIEKQLNDLGIFHFWQIAELSAAAAHNVGEEVGLPGRVDGWVDAGEADDGRSGISPRYRRTLGAFANLRLQSGLFAWQISRLQMVKELREKTGAGMMDCKSALSETNGDIEAAVDWLRKKGLAKAAKKAGRVAAEGLIGIAIAGHKGVVVEVNAETDFVARNDLFQGLVKMIADVALTTGPDVEKIKAAKAGSQTMAEAIASTIATIGENMTLRRAAQLSVGKGAIGSYVHNSIAEGLGKIGVIVALESAGTGRRTQRARAACSPCMSRPPIRRPWMPQVSIRRSSRARRMCSPTSSRRRASRQTSSTRLSNPA